MAVQTNRTDGEQQRSTDYDHLIDADEATGDVSFTARAFESFPAGHECDLTIDDLPDDEADYGWTDHYEEDSRTRRAPAVTDDVIDELLTNGVVLETPNEAWDDRYLVQAEIDGYEWTIVVADDGDCDRERWVLITVYSNYHGSVGVTNRYFDRLEARRTDDEVALK